MDAPYTRRQRHHIREGLRDLSAPWRVTSASWQSGVARAGRIASYFAASPTGVRQSSRLWRRNWRCSERRRRVMRSR